MSDPVWLGVDVGTQGVRAVVLDDAGTQLGSGSAALPPGHRTGAQHEQDPHAWWPALAAATRAALTELPGRTIGALALDATSGTVLIQDPDGKPAGPALMYDDARAAEHTERCRGAAADLAAALGFRIQPSWALPKLCWLQGRLGPGQTIAHQSDHLAGRLIGTPVACDTSSALKSAADPRVPGWPADVFAALHIDLDRLPQVVLPGTVLGTVCPEAAEETGIPAGTPVRAGMTDGCAAQIAVGALAPGEWSSALGTTLILKGATAELLHDPAGAVYSHRNPDGGWLPGGASSTGAGVLRTVFPGADLDQLTAAADLTTPAPGVTYPLAGTGERFPFVAPEATGFALTAPTDPAGRFSAILQGISLIERLAFDTLRGLGAELGAPIALSGGVTGNHAWNQLRADILNHPVELAASAEAATGMAVLAAAPPGELAATARRMIRRVRRFDPDPVRGARFAEPYARLCAALVDRGWLTAAPTPVWSAP
ncbi:MAG TPA: FGGY family carbohydrate kinase [Pseudonocardiaceae bacterium]|nr:FGGY family carbohydrate kinase [Pseudonocardiaceae bacterium]